MGSYYGWIFPPEIPFETVVEEVTAALESCGFHRRDKPLYHHWEFVTGEGHIKMFNFLSKESTTFWKSDYHVIYELDGDAWFRPVELDFNPECFESTLAGYDLAKQVFDSCRATECFGCHESQDNAVSLEDSDLNFFFTRCGPQLALAHLDERRLLLPEEVGPVASFHDEYEEFRPWDLLLHSDFFTRFTEELHKGYITEYARTNRLIERTWEDYFGAGRTMEK